MAFVITHEIKCLAKKHGIEKLGFFTLTFSDHVTKMIDAQKRFNSLNTHVLKGRYSNAIGVVERQESMRLHFHLVVVLARDIRTGFDFAALERRDYSSASSALREEWCFWREACARFGFGRHELLPVKSSAEGIAYYVGGYVAKNVEQRIREDKGARMVRFIGYHPATRHAYSTFAWNNSNGWLWRHKLAAWCKAQNIETLDRLKEIYGRRWAYLFQEEIMATRVDEVHPDLVTAERSSNLTLVGHVKAQLVEEEKERRAPGARVYQLKERVYEQAARVVEFQKQQLVSARK